MLLGIAAVAVVVAVFHTTCRLFNNNPEGLSMPSTVQKFLDKLPAADENKQNWLIDKEAEYRMMGYSEKDAKEKAMLDWCTYMVHSA